MTTKEAWIRSAVIYLSMEVEALPLPSAIPNHSDESPLSGPVPIIGECKWLCWSKILDVSFLGCPMTTKEAWNKSLQSTSESGLVIPTGFGPELALLACSPA